MNRSIHMDQVSGYPCKRCGVRPDVSCRHRPADQSWTMGAPPVETDLRRLPVITRKYF